jgi:steroid delta-isomerase-like uncharacterized protein
MGSFDRPEPQAVIRRLGSSVVEMGAIERRRADHSPSSRRESTMSLDENKSVVRHLFDAVNAGDLDRVLDCVAEDIAVHTSIPGITPGREGFRQFIGVYLSAFPEQRVEIHELVAEGDRVLVRHTHHVTHGGEFAGMPPTGKQAIVDGLELFRVNNGQIAEMWHHDDLLSLLQQLGAVPTPERAGV